MVHCTGRLGNIKGSGVINFTGKVINAPCSIPGDGTINVDLGQVANKVLETGNKYSQSVQYNIQLENCDLGEVKDASDVVVFPAVSKVKVTFTVEFLLQQKNYWLIQVLLKV
ncbi:fimbrial protein [Providencia hangzhouensis]